MNHCPVYGSVGGHAYGWVYPGPVGAVLTPNLIGLEKAHHLPNASTFCGRCEAVCPVRIPLPDLMRRLRRQQFESGLLAKRYKLMLKAWAWLAKHPFLYRKLTGLGLMIFAFLANKRGSVRDVPFAKNWTAGRDLPVPEGESFHSLWRKRSRK
jgi:L-lactate dehydrogenase complex protein LldF